MPLYKRVRCKDCLWFRHITKQDLGYCHGQTPQSGFTKWPKVHINDFCPNGYPIELSQGADDEHN